MPQKSQGNPSDGPPFTIFIGNLPTYALECDIEMILQGIEHDRIRLIKDKETDEFKGFAYVDILDEESLDKALTLNNAMLDENKIRVNIAENNRPNNFGAGGGRGRRGGSAQNGGGNFHQRGGGNFGGGRGGGRGNFQRGANSSRGSYNNRGPYHNSNSKNPQNMDNSQVYGGGGAEYPNYNAYNNSHPNSRGNRFPRNMMGSRARIAGGGSRGMGRGGGGVPGYGGGRGGGGYNNWNQGGGHNARGGGGGWQHHRGGYQNYYAPANYNHPPRNRVTSTGSRNNDPLPAPLTEEERANRPRLNLLPRTVGASNSESSANGSSNNFVMTERNVAIFGKSITRSANTSTDPSPAATLADPAVISVSSAPQNSCMDNNPGGGHKEHEDSMPVAQNGGRGEYVGDGETATLSMQTSIPDSRAIPDSSFSAPSAAHGGSFSGTQPNGGSSNSSVGASASTGHDKPPDHNEHSDSGFRSEDGTGDSHGTAPSPPDVKHLENKLHALSVDN